MRLLIPLVVLGLAFSFTGCQTPKSFAIPDASWKSHIGQLKFSDRKRTVIGDVVVRQRGDNEFQLDFQKAAGIPLIAVRSDNSNTRVEGLLSHGSWQRTTGGPAPAHLRSWVELHEAFAHPGARGGFWAKAEAKSEGGQLSSLFLVSPQNDRFVFQFAH